MAAFLEVHAKYLGRMLPEKCGVPYYEQLVLPALDLPLLKLTDTNACPLCETDVPTSGDHLCICAADSAFTVIVNINILGCSSTHDRKVGDRHRIKKKMPKIWIPNLKAFIWNVFVFVRHVLNNNYSLFECSFSK